LERKFSYKALKIECRNRVSNKSIGSNHRIGVVASQRRDPTDLQSLENGNFIGWWYIEHSGHYSSCNALLNYLIILLGDIVYSYILYAF